MQINNGKKKQMQRKIIENKSNRKNKIIFAYFLKHPDTFIPLMATRVKH